MALLLLSSVLLLVILFQNLIHIKCHLFVKIGINTILWKFAFSFSNLLSSVLKLTEYAVTNKYDDLVTVDSNGTRNGAVRIIKKEYVQSGMMSRRVGSHLDDCTNIHSEDDLKQAEINIKSKKWTSI